MIGRNVLNININIRHWIDFFHSAGKPAKKFHGVGIGPLSKILAVNVRLIFKNFSLFHDDDVFLSLLCIFPVAFFPF